jgi:hypothetical protein
MKFNRTFFATGIFLILIMLSLSSCFSVPHLLLPKKDVSSREITVPNTRYRVLITSSSGEFKEGLIDTLIQELVADTIAVRVTRLKNLKKIKTIDYAAVVLINSCWSWDMDRNVKKFLKLYPDDRHIIVVTTSGAGNWQPKQKTKNCDAISTASQIERITPLVQDIFGRIHQLTHR